MNSKSRTVNAASAQPGMNTNSGNGKREVNLSLEMLSAEQVLAIDRALKEIGDFGEVRLIVTKGHLRFIGKFKTEALESSL